MQNMMNWTEDRFVSYWLYNMIGAKIFSKVDARDVLLYVKGAFCTIARNKICPSIVNETRQAVHGLEITSAADIVSVKRILAKIIGTNEPIYKEPRT